MPGCDGRVKPLQPRVGVDVGNQGLEGHATEELGAWGPSAGSSPVPAGHLPPIIPQRLLAGQEPVFWSQERWILQDLVERVGEEGLQLRARGRVTAAGMLNPVQGSRKVVRGGARVPGGCG